MSGHNSKTTKEKRSKFTFSRSEEEHRSAVVSTSSESQMPFFIGMVGLLLVCLGSFASIYFVFMYKGSPRKVVEQPAEVRQLITAGEMGVESPQRAISQELTFRPPSSPQAKIAEEPVQGVYRYTDNQGVICFVDAIGKVPQEQRDQVHFTATQTELVDVQIINDQVVVPVMLTNGANMVKAHLLLDTGCNVTSISKRLADRLRITPNQSRSGTSRVADGRVLPTRIAVIDRLVIGNRSQLPTTVQILDGADRGAAFDGLLGMNFLKEHPYQVDFERGILRWR